ncbi:hypothetical protein TWF718_008571 [Orbilia javanica]|uniref:UBC core domain-containing protein n=1 Tax=Orbilia javanica TaxID=47235 RepID=A0AAN8MQN2_9PEZI
MASRSAAPNKRLIQELNKSRQEQNPALTYLAPFDDSDLHHWRAGLKGTADSPYEGGVWEIDIMIPDNYPIVPPTIKFITKICHPNIDAKTGEICLDLLKSEWSAAYTISSTMTVIQTLLTSPEPNSPLNVDAAALLRAGDTMGYESLVRYYVWRYARKADD